MKIKVYVVDFEVPARAKAWALRVGIPLVVLLGGGAIAWAGGLHVWKTADTLQAADLNGNFANLQGQITALSTLQTAVLQGPTTPTCSSYACGNTSFTGSLVGGTPPSSPSQLVWQVGTVTATTNAAGYATVGFPYPLTHGVYAVIISGAQVPDGYVGVQATVEGSATTLTSFGFNATDGSTQIVSTSLSFSFIAVGW
jgi:hypothetical protein